MEKLLITAFFWIVSQFLLGASFALAPTEDRAARAFTWGFIAGTLSMAALGVFDAVS